LQSKFIFEENRISTPEGTKMSDYVAFKRFITPTFIMIIYILGALAITILSILMMLGGFAAIILGDFVNGIWIIFLGWFIRSGAETSLRQTHPYSDP
jgi:hypothetical protein